MCLLLIKNIFIFRLYNRNFVILDNLYCIWGNYNLDADYIINWYYHSDIITNSNTVLLKQLNNIISDEIGFTISFNTSNELFCLLSVIRLKCGIKRFYDFRMKCISCYPDIYIQYPFIYLGNNSYNMCHIGIINLAQKLFYFYFPKLHLCYSYNIFIINLQNELSNSALVKTDVNGLFHNYLFKNSVVYFNYCCFKFNSGLRGFLINKVITNNILIFDFKLFYSSIIMNLLRFVDGISCIFIHIIETLYNMTIVLDNNRERMWFKLILNVFFGAIFCINYSRIVFTIGEMLLSFSIDYFLQFYEIIGCNVDGILLKVNSKYNIHYVLSILYNYLCKHICYISWRIRFGSVKHWIIGRDFNNYVVFTLGKHNMVSVKGYFTKYQKLLELMFIHYKCNVVMRDMCNVENFIFAQYLSLKIILHLFWFFYYKLGIVCFLVEGKRQCRSSITMLARFVYRGLRDVIFLIEKLLIKEYFCCFTAQMTLCVFLYDYLALDFDDIIPCDEFILSVVKMGCIIVYSYNRKRLKVIVKCNPLLKYRSIQAGIEVLHNQWVNVYGVHHDNFFYHLFISKLTIIKFELLLKQFSYYTSIIRCYRDKFYGSENKNINSVESYYTYFDFDTRFQKKLGQFLKLVGSNIVHVKKLSSNYNHVTIKYDIRCGAHTNNNKQAYCYLNYKISHENNVCDLLVFIKCAGTRCSIDYSSISNEIKQCFISGSI